MGRGGGGQLLDVAGNIEVNQRITTGTGDLHLTSSTRAIDLYDGSGAHTLNIFTSSTNAVSLNSGGNSYFNGGNVGIGTTAPGGTLSVVSGNTTGLTTSSALNLSANSLTTGTGLYAASSTLTSGKLVDLQVSGTAAAASQTALNILTAGANATSGITTYGAQISNTHTNATSGTNVALYLNASGATTANYGLIVNAGRVGIGSTAPATRLHIASSGNTEDQLRLENTGTGGRAYDFYVTDNTSSLGGGIFNFYDITGSASRFQINSSGDLALGGNITASFAGASMVVRAAGNVGIGNTAPGAILDVGKAGTTRGIIRLEGNTSGYVDVKAKAAAGSWGLTLPGGVGSAGQQLTDAAGDGVTSWAAASSLRSLKNIVGLFDTPSEALNKILNTNVYRFHYKPDMGTGDTNTEYVGVMADEAPWAMHYNGTVVNPVNTLGYMVLGFQALNEKVAKLQELEGTIDAQGKEIEDLKQQLQKLQN